MRQRIAFVFCALVLLAGCGKKEPIGPVAGELVVTLTSPGTTDGAVLLRLVGPVDEVQAVGGYLVESAALPGGITRIVVVGTITSGPVARISIPDMSQASQYFGLVEQVADRGSYALVSVAGYSVSVSP